MLAEPSSTGLLGRPRVQAASARWLLARSRPHVVVLPIAVVSAVANLWALTSAGWGNAYYAAAVRSMGSSWHNLLFAAFDDGFVSVDKPPLSLWMQVASTKVLGYSPLAVLLPQALAGVASVLLLYVGVTRSWGRAAGAVAAAGLAVTPMAVMVAHSNNTDAGLVLCMTASAVAGLEAVRRGRLRWLALACVLGGLALTAKMSAAVPVLPGLLAAYLWCAPRSWRIRVAHAAAGALLLTVSGGWWFALVERTDPSQRPYVGSTRRNSVVELAVERNGVNQVEGNGAGAGPGGGPGTGRPGGPRSAQAGRLPPPGFTPPAGGGLGGLLPGIPAPPGAGGAFVPRGPGFGGGPGGPGGGFGLGFAGGEPGPLRLLNRDLGAQAGWLLPLAAAGVVSALVLVGVRGSPRLAAVVVMGGWAAAAGLIFSRTQGILHPYYTAQMAPPLAAMSGVGFAAFRDLAQRTGPRRFGVLVLPFGLGVTAVSQSAILRRFDWRHWLVPLIVSALMISALATLLIAAQRPRRGLVSWAGLIAVALSPLLAPAVWTQGSLAAGVNPMLPYANPVDAPNVRRLDGGITPNGGTQFATSDTARLVDFLRRERGGSRYLVGVPSAGVAEPIIILFGEPVMTLGGFIGNDPIIDPEELAARIDAGEIRFFLASSQQGRGPFGSNEAMSWVTSSCPVVDASVWGGDTAVSGTDAVFSGGPSGSAFTLYDCAAR